MTFSPTILGTGIGGYAFLTRTRDQQMDTFARSPQVARDMAYFQDAIKSVETVDQLMDDRRLLGVALGAFGLGDDLDNSGFIRRVLESDLNDPRSLANSLSEKKYLALARAFNFNGTPQLPGSDATNDVKPELQALNSAADLFSFANERLLNRTLEVFDLEGDAGRPVFLETVMRSDLDDPNSLANRLDKPAYAALARAFQGVEPKVDAAFLRQLSDDIGARLEAATTSDDLVADRTALRAALSVFGLEGDIDNTFFLQSVLDSDLTDPDSFANRQRDPRYAELAAVFDYNARGSERDSIYGYVDVMKDKLDQFATVDDLIDDSDALNATLKVFGLERDSFLGTEDNLRAVLTSDLTDDASVANTASDPRYKALAQVFGFGEILAGEEVDEAQRRLVDMVETVEGLRAPLKTGEDFVADTNMLLASMNFFDLPTGEAGGSRLRRVATSDPDDPTSLLNLVNDPSYNAFHAAMNFQPEEEPRTYPAGFASAVTEAYLERQFEIQVGEVDQNMRIALSLERELTDVTNNVTSNDARWFQVMSSSPLRAAFEAALQLPSSFGSLDLDRQLVDFKERAQSILGTNQIGDLLAPDKIDQLRDGFLLGTSLTTTSASTGSTNAALTLLGGALSAQQDSGFGSVLNLSAQL